MLGVLRVVFFENTCFIRMCDFQKLVLANVALERCNLQGLEHPLKSVKVKRVSALVVVLAG